MWCFREREKILDIFEVTSGARLTCNYMRIGGVAFDLRVPLEVNLSHGPSWAAAKD